MEPTINTFADFAFSHISGIGPRTYQKLIQYFHSSHAAYTAPQETLSNILQDNHKLKNILTFRNQNKADKMYFDTFNKGVHFIDHKALQKIFINCLLPDLPIGIFAKGDIALLSKPYKRIAIIGSRKPTPYGIYQAEKLVQHLSSYNCFVLSGLAIGIDSIAHKSALKYGLQTLSVLGSGFNHVHPKTNLGLYRAIESSGGLHLTEFSPDVSPSPGTFRIRNRIIAALADAVVVIEGNRTSGTRITATYAIDQNKDVFALPGPVSSPLSVTPHQLIQAGAHLLDTPSYLTDFYHMEPHTKQLHMSELNLNSLSSEEISKLELDGHIQRQPDGTYTMLQ